MKPCSDDLMPWQEPCGFGDLAVEIGALVGAGDLA
jgi:hypothetical protein